MKIVIGGQVEKKEIEALIRDIDTNIEIVIKSDLDAAMEVKSGNSDFYLGACHTGGGGALAMAIAMLGRNQCETVSMPGRKPNEKKVVEAVQNGKKAFGFTGDHVETAVPMIIKALKANE